LRQAFLVLIWQHLHFDYGFSLLEIRFIKTRGAIMEIEFYGATRRVTGSCHILRAGGYTVLAGEPRR